MNSGAGRDIVVVAASAGGVEALLTLLPLLPADLPAAILVVLHVPAAGGRTLPGILGRAGRLPAVAAVDGEPLHPGHVYVAPPNHHLLVIDGMIRLSTGPRHQGHRPAADPLFFSAALTAGPRTIAVVLSGTLHDSAAGCAAVERRGGIVLIQDPAESAYQGMPRAALAATRHATVLRLREMAARIDEQSRGPAPGPDLVSGPDLAADLEFAAELERKLGIFLNPGYLTDWIQFPDPVRLAEPAWRPAADPAAAGHPVPAATGSLACPECGRPLRPADGAPLRFVCDAGHIWSAENLAAAQAIAIGRALWAAVFLLEERARSSYLLADAAESQGQPISGKNFRSAARASRAASVMVRKVLNWATRAGVSGPGSGRGS
jgi:two-component system chemotaxis response regulator CheB